VNAREIPQEVGNFAILLDCGWGRTRAMLLNGLCASVLLPGAIVAYFWLREMQAAVPHILALSAASFICIAAADLIPELHRQTGPMVTLRQVTLLMAGVVAVAQFHSGV
jgi:zinc and cadmium transporter